MTLTAYACSWPSPDGNQYRLHPDEPTALAQAQSVPTPAVVFELDVEMTVAQWVRLQFEWAFPGSASPSRPTPDQPRRHRHATNTRRPA